MEYKGLFVNNTEVTLARDDSGELQQIVTCRPNFVVIECGVCVYKYDITRY